VLALARRGVEVWGVDTGELAPSVLALPHVHHIAKKVGALRWEELPPRIDWLLVDVNLAPQVALHEVGRLDATARAGAARRGAHAQAQRLDVRRRATGAGRADPPDGLPDVRVRHLPSNRREVCAVALR